MYCVVKRVVMSRSRPSLLELTNALSMVAADWDVLGLQLGVPADELNVIRANNPRNVRQCMSVMLEWWRAKYPERGWMDIIVALRRLDRNDVANEVTTKYCKLTYWLVRVRTR